jgi:hypothetical protein
LCWWLLFLSSPFPNPLPASCGRFLSPPLSPLIPCQPVSATEPTNQPALGHREIEVGRKIEARGGERGGKSPEGPAFIPPSHFRVPLLNVCLCRHPVPVHTLHILPYILKIPLTISWPYGKGVKHPCRKKEDELGKEKRRLKVAKKRPT